MSYLRSALGAIEKKEVIGPFGVKQIICYDTKPGAFGSMQKVEVPCPKEPIKPAPRPAGPTTEKPGFLETLFGGIKKATAATGAPKSGGTTVIQAGGGGTPGWVMPVAIGGLGLAAVYFLMRK